MRYERLFVCCYFAQTERNALHAAGQYFSSVSDACISVVPIYLAPQIERYILNRVLLDISVFFK